MQSNEGQPENLSGRVTDHFQTCNCRALFYHWANGEPPSVLHPIPIRMEYRAFVTPKDRADLIRHFPYGSKGSALLVIRIFARELQSATFGSHVELVLFRQSVNAQHATNRHSGVVKVVAFAVLCRLFVDAGPARCVLPSGALCKCLFKRKV